MKTKTCTKCLVEKPITGFSEKKNYNKTNTVYYHTYCKKCLVKDAIKWRNKNRERFNEYQRGYWHRVRKYAIKKETK